MNTIYPVETRESLLHCKYIWKPLGIRNFYLVTASFTYSLKQEGLPLALRDNADQSPSSLLIILDQTCPRGRWSTVLSPGGQQFLVHWGGGAWINRLCLVEGCVNSSLFGGSSTVFGSRGWGSVVEGQVYSSFSGGGGVSKHFLVQMKGWVNSSWDPGGGVGQ